MEIRSQLKNIPELADVPDDQLDWLIEESEEVHLEAGQYLFSKGDPIDRLLVIISGHFSLKIEQAGNFRLAGEMEGPGISGLLPYSRATHAIGYADATRPSHVLSLDKSHFRHMITHHEELTTAFVHVMSTRIREFTRREQQNDKMMALGKLSAGLAHELNNPSAAVVRSAQILSKHLKLLPGRFKDVIKIRAKDEEVDAVNEILFAKIESGIQPLSMIERSDREDELLDWLEDQDIPEAEEITQNFVDYGFSEDDLEEIKDLLRESDLAPVIHWLNQVLTTERLVNEIEEASNRINTLVSSVKSYTHMDQAPEKQRTDIHKGIENTLTMLNHKLKKGNVKVVKDFDPELPAINILIGEMNQVWTNLIDNAIDAMAGRDDSTLSIRTKRQGKYANIYITDSGSGIPEDIIEKIFDPFFTTKAIGEGTGIGLELVHQIVTRQHKGMIEVSSKPGETTFHVCIPIDG